MITCNTVMLSPLTKSLNAFISSVYVAYISKMVIGSGGGLEKFRKYLRLIQENICSKMHA